MKKRTARRTKRKIRLPLGFYEAEIRRRVKIRLHMRKRRKPVRLYRMTIATFWYDKPTHQLIEYEIHIKIARRSIHVRTVRRRLAKRGAAYFQRWLRRERKISIPKRKLKIAFEREAHAKKQKGKASVRRFAMRRVKGRWTSKELPPGTMSYVRRRRKKRAKYSGKRRARR